MPDACVVFQGREFAAAAGAAEVFFRGRGFTVRKVDLEDKGLGTNGPEGYTIDTLPSGCDVSAWYAHGGWDGPGLFLAFPGQIDPNQYPRHWPVLTAALRRHIRVGGLFVVHACHSAGSHQWEATHENYGERWVQQVAEETQRYAVGVEGVTAAANSGHALALLRFALDGTRWLQASRAYAPGGVRVVDWRGWTRTRNAR